MITRRGVLKTAASIAAGGATIFFANEALAAPIIARYAPRLPDWPSSQKLTIACIADIHAGEPHAGLDRVTALVDSTNTLLPDLIVLLGDYAADHRFVTREVPPPDLARALARLKAPLGVHAILGNHDYWGRRGTRRPGDEALVRANAAEWTGALSAAGIPVLVNQVLRIATPGGGFWLAGTASNLAVPLGDRRFRGLDDLPATLSQAADRAPLILLAHEPDLFVTVPDRVALTLSGHTHGGQVRLPLIGSPWIPSRYGSRFIHGHIVETGRHLIVSAGIGTSAAPIRLRAPPEIVHVTLGV